MRIFTHNEEAYGWNVIGIIRGQLEPGGWHSVYLST